MKLEKNINVDLSGIEQPSTTYLAFKNTWNEVGIQYWGISAICKFWKGVCLHKKRIVERYPS